MRTGKKHAISSLIVIDWAAQPALVGMAERRGDRIHLEKVATLDSIEESEVAADAPVHGLIGRDEVVMRRLQLPHIPAVEIAGVVESEAVRQFEFDETHSVIDHAVADNAVAARIGSESDGSANELHVDIAILSRSVIAGCQATATPLGGSLQQLGLRPFATWNAMCHATGEPDAVTLLVVESGRMIELTIGIGRHVVLSNAASATGLAGQIRRILAISANRFPNLAVERIVLAGDISGAESLAAELSIEVDVFDPLEAIDIGSNLRDCLQSENISHGACTGIIGALLASHDCWPIDFLNSKQTAIRPSPTHNRFVIAGAILAAVLVVGLVAVQTVIANGSRRIEELVAQRAVLDAQLKDAEQTLDQFRVVDLACAERGNCLVELQRLSEAVSDKRRLYAMSLTFEFDNAITDDHQIVIEGFATDHEAISAFQQSLDGQPVGAVSGTSRRGDYQFSFKSGIPVPPPAEVQ